MDNVETQIYWHPGVTLDSIEKQVILAAFRFFRGVKTTTASALGISVRTLDNKLEQYKLDAQSNKEREENEKRKHAEYIRRARGPFTPNNVYLGSEQPAVHARQPNTEQRSVVANNAEGKAPSQNGDGNASGVRVEPASQSSEKSAMPVSERKEVQSVSRANPPQSGAKRNR